MIHFLWCTIASTIECLLCAALLIYTIMTWHGSAGIVWYFWRYLSVCSQCVCSQKQCLDLEDSSLNPLTRSLVFVASLAAPGAPHSASRGRGCDRLCPHQTKLWSLGPGLDWASASLCQSQICSVSHYSGDSGQLATTIVTSDSPAWHLSQDPRPRILVCDAWQGYVLWHHVTCDGEECH